MTNCNPHTGIRYGTIYLNNLDPDTADHLFYEGTNISEQEAYKEAKAEIEATVKNEIADAVSDGEEPPYDEDDIDREVEHRLERWAEGLQIEEPYIEGECEGVNYGISHLGGAALLWVYESPHLTRARLCSPCVPGAIDLDSVDADGEEGYDVPPDWRVKP